MSDDLISRETMKDAIDNTTWYHQNRNGVMVEGAHGVEDAWFKAEDVFKAIENVPTAQVNTPTDTPTDTISRQAAIDATWEDPTYTDPLNVLTEVRDKIKALPSAQTEQTKMIEEIRKWINSGNRGSADYFIVDKIEEIINKAEPECP